MLDKPEEKTNLKFDGQIVLHSQLVNAEGLHHQLWKNPIQGG